MNSCGTKGTNVGRYDFGLDCDWLLHSRLCYNNILSLELFCLSHLFGLEHEWMWACEKEGAVDCYILLCRHANGLLTLLFFHGDLIWFTFTSCYLLFSLLYTPSFSLSLSVSSLHPVIISSAVVPFFPDSPSRSLPSHSNPATLPSPLVYLYTLFFFPPSSPQFSLLQVVKWILLSQSHHGKGRKRKRMEPKVNYKEVGGTLLY